MYHYTLIHLKKKINSKCVQFYNAWLEEKCNIIMITLNYHPSYIGGKDLQNQIYP